MLHHNQEVQNTKKTMQKIAKHKEERDYVRQRDIDLCKKLQDLNRQSKTIQRSKDKNRIRKFNEIFFDTVRQLTNIRRMQGKQNVREVEAIINEWKAKHYEF